MREAERVVTTEACCGCDDEGTQLDNDGLCPRCLACVLCDRPRVTAKHCEECDAEIVRGAARRKREAIREGRGDYLRDQAKDGNA